MPINNRPNSYDYESYRMLPPEDRWLMNKLMIAEKQGLLCGPVGETPPEGTYCVRPVMNLTGGGNPGFFKWTVGPNGENNELVSSLPGGYFWCEWLDGMHYGFDFMDDVQDKATVSTAGTNADYMDIVQTSSTFTLPDWAKGKYRFMSVETIGDKIIEINPRYQWDMTGMRRETNPDGSFRWVHINATRPVDRGL